MPRRKPASAKQRKAQLQVKRALKRGEAPPQSAASTSGTGNREHPERRHRGKQPVNANVHASRRLESSFVKFLPVFLEEAKRKASSLVIDRPIVAENLLFPISTITSSGGKLQLTVPKRPKWRYDMSKKEVESNEAGIFKRWLDETDRIIEAWKAEASVSGYTKDSSEQVPSTPEEQSHQEFSDSMPYASPLFERNLEVWRQLWRVIEICQVLLVLLDSRCPPLHFPQSLDAYLTSFRPPRKVIFVLTKVDITGQKISSLWKAYLRNTYPNIRVVTVESYLEKAKGEGQGKRIFKEPHIPGELRRDLVQALKESHKELCSPPLHIASDANKSAAWKPSVLSSVDWDAIVNAADADISYGQVVPREHAESDERSVTESDKVEDFLSVGLIGQPNVGKSSLLNALFGSHKVKASKTPGKTKHFQTMFWTKQVRLVDCPGLVFPGFADLEMQVLAGILPIAQIPAIPSSIYHALQYLPLEKILGLQHPMEKEGAISDKRTWRSGMQPTKSDKRDLWTAMDVLTAFAEQKGWITAKAGRPDVNRAGNFILRMLAEGRIKWAFCPPDTDLNALTGKNKGLGIWIEGGANDDSLTYADSDSEVDSEDSITEAEDDGSVASQSGEESKIHGTSIQSGICSRTGMFDALTLKDDPDSGEGSGE